MYFQVTNTIKKSALFCVFCLYCVLCSGLSESQPLVAIISVKEATSSLADAVTAQLTGKNIRLVERQEIARIIAEQKLNSSGLVNPQTAIRLGQLLKADIIAPLTTESLAGERIVAFDVKTGIRLQDLILEHKNFEGKTLEATAAITATVEKQQLLKKKDIILLSFMPVNMVLLQDKKAESANKAQALLQRKLLQQRQYLLLERDYAELLINEKIIISQDISSLESCTYTIELEVRPAGQQENLLSLELFLKNNNRALINKFAVNYAVGDENKAVEEILSNFIGITLPSGGESSSANRIAEARVFLLDGQKAYRNMDYDKSLLSLKNAYLLDAGLKYEINQTLIQIRDAQRRSLNAATQDSVKVKLSGQILERLIFYKQINGSTLSEEYVNLEILPEDLQNRFRAYFHECFMDRLEKIKRDYNYTLLKPNTLEYLKCFEQYLSALSEICPPDGFMFYMAPDLATFFKAVNEYCSKNPQHCREFGDSSINLIYWMNGFRAPGYVFDKDLFNKTIDFYSLMLKSPIIRWQFKAIFYIGRLRYELINGRGRPHEPQSIKEAYELEFISRIKPSLLLSEFDDADYNNQFIMDVIRKAIGNPDIKGLCQGFFYENYYKHGNRDPQLEKTIFAMGLQAGFDMRSALDQLYRPISESSQGYINRYMALKQHIAFLNNKNIEAEIDKKIAQIKVNMASLPVLETYLESYQTIMTHPFYRLDSDGHNTSISFSSTLLRDDKYWYLTLNSACDEYFSLIKIDYKDNFKLIRGQEGHLNYERKPYYTSYNDYCISKNYIVKISSYGGIFIYPKDGSMPTFVAKQEIQGKKINAALSVGDKVYFMQSPDFAAYYASEFQIMEFDLEAKVLKLVFSSNQLDNNPISDLRRMPNRDYFIVDEAGKSLVFALNYPDTHWRFLPSSGKWDELNEKNYSEIVQNNNQSKTIFGGQKNSDDDSIGWNSNSIIFIRHNKTISVDWWNADIKSIIPQNGKRYCLYVRNNCNINGKEELYIGLLKDINQLLPLASVPKN